MHFYSLKNFLKGHKFCLISEITRPSPPAGVVFRVLLHVLQYWAQHRALCVFSINVKWMTLFSSFTCPEGKGLDAGKVITTPPGLLDFHLGHYPVCVCVCVCVTIFPFGGLSPSAKKDSREYWPFSAVSPRCRQSALCREPQRTPRVRRLKSECFISVLGESSLSVGKSHFISSL